MSKHHGKFCDFTVHLEKKEDFFIDPEPNPFSKNPQYESGISQLYYKMEGSSLKEIPRVNLFLPEEAEEKNLTNIMLEALKPYCEQHIRLNRDELALNRRDGFEVLKTGLIAALSFFTFVLILFFLFPDSQIVLYLITPIFTIASWVSIWRPVETFLFDGKPFKRNIRVYQNMEKMELTINYEKT